MKRTKEISVLVVDDEIDFAEALRENFDQEGGYRVRCESDPENVCRAAREFKPDIILLDIVMPGLDGGDVAQCLRSDPKLREIPVLYVTALADNADLKESVMTTPAGEHILAKPFRFRTLCEYIDGLFALEN